MKRDALTIRVASYGLIVEAQKLLLCRLSSKVPHLEGIWTLPGGGLEFGEDPKSAMIREVEEETGLTVKAVELADIDSLYDAASTPEFHGVRIIYHAAKLSGSLRHEVTGTTDKAAWFTEKEIENLPLVSLAKMGAEIAFSQPSCG